MFLQFWILWLLLGLMATVLVFAWALRTGQFEEERRSALLPFDDMKLEPPPAVREGQWHLWILRTVLFGCFALVSGAIALTIIFGGGSR